MSWILYGGLAILMIYMMSKGGGCCGGGHSSQGNHGGHDGYQGGGGGCCGGGHSDNEGNNTEQSGHTINSTIGTVQDPVCGMYVPKQDAIARQINGQTYYFCSNSCADKFERKYMS